MNKYLLLFLLLLPATVVAKKKVKYEYVYDYYVTSSTETRCKHFDDSKIRIDFSWNPEVNRHINIKVRNDTNARMTIEWENARIGGSRVAFLYDEINRDIIPIPDEVVHAEESSYKNIMRRSYDYYYPIFHLDSLNFQGATTTTTFIIPIKFGNEIIDYKIDVTVCLLKMTPK